MNTETRVGALFFVCLALAIGFTFFATDLGSGQGSYRARFDRVVGLESGSKVTYNGVPVGRVQRVLAELDAEGAPGVAVWFDLAVDPNLLPLGAGSELRVVNGLLGGSQLEIMHRGPGVAFSQLGLDALRGRDPVSIGDAIDQIAQLVGENRADLRAAVARLPDAIDNIATMAEEIRGTVADNRAQVGEAIGAVQRMAGGIADTVAENRAELARAITEFADMATELRAAVTENRENLRDTIARMPAAVENLSQAAAQVRDAVADNREDLRRLMTALGEAGPKIERIASDIQTVSTQVASGQGTLGKLVFEDSLHQKAEAAIDGLGQRMEEVKPFTSGFSDLRFYLAGYGGMNLRSEVATYGVGLRIEPKPWKFYEGGLSYRTAGDRTVDDDDPRKLNMDFNLLLGYRFFPDEEMQRYRLSLAAGLIDSQLGGTVDLALFDNLTLRNMVRMKSDGYDENERRYEDGSVMLRSYLEWRPWRPIMVMAGVDDIADRPGAWFGIRGEILDNDIRNLSSVMALGSP